MGMNAVYPYIESRNEELRFSLRSLQRHTDLEPIVIGDKPQWYNGRHIPFPRSAHKITNVYFKIRRACLEKKISDTFLLMNDDIYLLRKMPNVHFVASRIENLWSEYSDSHKNSYYTRCLANTVVQVGTAYNYETHTPMWIDKEIWMKINPDWFIDDPPLFRTLYGSMSDLKVKDIHEGETLRGGETKYYKHLQGDELDKFIKGKPCFSTPDSIRIKEDLERLFPEKSKWEI